MNSRMLTGAESRTKRILSVSFAAFLITLCLMALMLLINGCAPFSKYNSLAINDASIQYLDFHKYWKNVLDGNDSIEYSFGKTLGGSAVAVFSYYLASPFSLLVHLFEPEEFNVFFDLAVALKIALAASFMCLFLLFRYERLKSMMALCLGLSYGIMQYNISQASNIMWLDGVYMLPLILLGTHQMLRNGTSLLLVVSTALSIIFNWYTGCVNCLFSSLYFLYEFATMGKHTGLVGFLKAGIVFGSHLLFSVALGSFLFLPSLVSLSTGGRGNVQLNSLNFSFLGNPLTAISSLAIGCTSSRGSVSLYCGVLPVVGLLGLFLSNAVSRKEKIVTFLSLLTLLLIFYWGPLFWLFSLLVDVSSFYSRYSYGGIFFIILFAGKYFSLDDNRVVRTVLFASAIYICALLLANCLTRSASIRGLLITCLLICAYCLVFVISCRFPRFPYGALLCIVCLDVFLEGYYVSSMGLKTDVANYIISTQEKTAQIKSIKDHDDGIYRISQTSIGLTANYNEALAYGYWSISGYTSDPDNRQRNLLDTLGYRKNGDNMCIVNTSIIPVDSLLGVKYVISSYAIQGLELESDIAVADEKAVYSNPYALPLAFTYQGEDEISFADSNPFKNIEHLYSSVLGYDVSFFVPVEFDSRIEDDSKVYNLDAIPSLGPVYGNIIWNKEMNARILVDGTFVTDYSKWLSPSVFFVPIDGNSTEVLLETENGVSILEEEFQQLDLEALDDAVVAIRQNNEVKHIEIRNGHVLVDVHVDNPDTNLFLSIPFDEGWSVELNGNRIFPNLIGDCLYSLPLPIGDSQVVLKYEVPLLTVSAIISLVAFSILIALGIVMLRRNGKTRDNR